MYRFVLVALAFAAVLAGCGSKTLNCTPETDQQLCARLGAQCGPVQDTDNCGEVRAIAECGACALPQTCGGGGAAHVCGVNQAVCSKDGWCWQNPLPAASDVRAVWGTSASDVWSVGMGGIIQRYNGDFWVRVAGSPTANNLLGLWGSGARDVWAVGDAGTLLHFDGTAWTATNSPTSDGLRTVFGFGANDVWAVGGKSNTASEPAVALHWNGGAWVSVGTLPKGALNVVWGQASNDVWAGGAYGERPVLLHWNGSAWEEKTAPKSVAEITGIGGAGGKLWLVGRLISGPGALFSWDGSNWSQVAIDKLVTMFSLRVFSATDAWAVGAKGMAIHWDGSNWSAPTAIATATLRGLWGTGSSGELWAGGDGGILFRYDGANWKPGSAATAENLRGIWASGPNDVWAVGAKATAVHFDGSRWTRQGLQDETDYPQRDDVLAVCGLDATHLWGAGTNAFLPIFLNDAWSAPMPAPELDTLNAIWAISPTSVWAGGGRLAASTVLLLHNTGAEWQKQTVTFPEIRGLWGCSDDDMWAVSVNGQINKWDAATTAWQLMEIKDSGGNAIPVGDLNAILGFGCEDSTKPHSIWVVGAAPAGKDGVLLHWDGTAWAAATTGVKADLKAIAGTRDSDLWAVGAAGTILHWDGTTWAPQESGTTASLNGVRATDSGVFAVGDTGTILFRANP